MDHAITFLVLIAKGSFNRTCGARGLNFGMHLHQHSNLEAERNLLRICAKVYTSVRAASALENIYICAYSPEPSLSPKYVLYCLLFMEQESGHLR